MPQNKQNSAGNKKKKGHAPAHQNKFAYKHNPKSKTTAKILASPNIHVCRRCHEKIEWRKQYRKYKPRTQPGTCNGCKKRNVFAAYHTICTACTTKSMRAKEIIQEATGTANFSEEEKGAHDQSRTGEEELSLTKELETVTNKTRALELALQASKKVVVVRACAMCVKEIALPDPEEEDEGDVLDGMGRIRLRDRRAIERRLEREAREELKLERERQEEEEKEATTNQNESTIRNGSGDSSDVDEITDDEEEDPFLRAIGGAGNLLTGKAYQEKLLQQQQQ